MLAVKGVIQGDTVIIQEGDLKAYDGKDVIVTILDYPYGQMEKGQLDLNQFVMPTDRGKNADSYIRELRENDRL